MKRLQIMEQSWKYKFLKRPKNRHFMYDSIFLGAGFSILATESMNKL